MTDALDRYRQILNDSQHPLHQAVWTLFSRSININSVDRRFGENKEALIELMYAILDTDELYNESSLGSGNAPINSVELLGHWKVEAAIPRLIRILNEEDWETIVHDRAILALEKMGPAVLEPLLELAANPKDPNQLVTIASILSDAAKGDPRAFEYIKTVFEEQTGEHDTSYMAENILAADMPAGIAYLEDRLKRGKVPKAARKRIEKYLRDAKSGTLFSFQLPD
jgi:HEAT repeat protein